MDQDEIQKALQHVTAQHRRVDLKIEEMQRESPPDMLAIQRLKKEKLKLKDEMARLQAMLCPDIIA